MQNIFHKHVYNASTLRHFKNNSPEYRYFWHWLNKIFNLVDTERIKEVGSNRACAEWLLKNGAALRWKGSKEVFNDYNSLSSSSSSMYIEEIDATESSIMHYGFPNLNGCKHIRKVILHKCMYIEDEALPYLELIKDSLIHLQISSCGNISDKGLQPIEKLSNLKILQLYDLIGVQNLEQVAKNLQTSLPNCTIDLNLENNSESQKK